MADSMCARERRNCWMTMSDLFVDNEVDYKDVAETLTRQCPNMPVDTLRSVFFDEVAPVLGPNGLTPVPAVWTYFDGDEVVVGITQRLERQRASFFYRAKSGCWSAMCRCLFRSIWEDLEKELMILSG